MLQDSIHNRVKSLVIKNILFINRGQETYIWFTLNPEFSRLTPRTLYLLMLIVKTIRFHAGVFWSFEDEELNSIELTKVDVAVDMKGAFITG